MKKAERDQRDTVILERRKQGATLAVIADEVGMSTAGVCHAMQRLTGASQYADDLKRRKEAGYRTSLERPCIACGKPCWNSDEFRKHQAHRVMCTTCRREKNTVACLFCEGTFVRKNSANVYCSKRCAQAASALARDANRVRVRCAACGNLFPIRPFKLKTNIRHFCSQECRYPHATKKRRRRVSRRANGGGHVRRAIVYDVPYERGIDPLTVFVEDGWRCGICGSAVDRRLVSPHPMRASLDHVIALSIAGTPGHVRSNVQCSHLRCNIRKNNRMQEKKL